MSAEVIRLDAWRASHQRVACSGGEALADSLTTPQRGEAPEGESSEGMYQRALTLLAHSAKSSHDLFLALQARGYARNDCRTVVARVVAEGLCDDTAYALRLVEKQRARAPLSRRGMEQVLRSHGIEGSIVAQLLDSEELADDRELAVEAARKYVRQHGEVAPETLKRRLFALLARRGFDASTSSAVVSDLIPR